MSTESDRELLDAYDAAAAALDGLLGAWERHTVEAGALWPAVDPTQLVSEIASTALLHRGREDAGAFPRHLASEVMVTRPGLKPSFEDVTIGGRLRRRVNAAPEAA
jgi:hypothetical protein